MEEKKVKIKELVGKGLGSYHTKVKQQIDRIEKKNKEQNHKISILTNELDNDYLTKTEEGSVISLEHSKEGMVYIDGLEGNTLVNYCTDGAKEMTLNGDIDLEGTFVTTTEGIDDGKVDVYCEGNTLVNHCTDGAKELTLNGEIDASGTFITTTEGADNGKVDVYCEGNTLVNLVNGAWGMAGSSSVTINSIENGYGATCTKAGSLVLTKGAILKDNTTYTFIFEINSTLPSIQMSYFNGVSYTQGSEGDSDTTNYSNNYTKIIAKRTTTTNCKNIVIGYHGTTSENTYINIKNMIVLEGDWTNKEMPAYFEGMKSVGQDDTNGHGIKLTSRNKNLFDMDRLSNTSTSAITNFVKNKETGRVEISYQANSGYPYLYYYLTSDEVEIFRGKKVFIKRDNIQYDAKLNHTIQLVATNADGTTLWVTDEKTIPQNVVNIKLQVHGHNSPSNTVTTDGTTIFEHIYIGIDEPGANYVYNKSNTKQIPLSAPLRGLPNGVKDKFVKKEGKWYVERNCGKIVLNGSNFEPYSSITSVTNQARWCIYKHESVKNIEQTLNAICNDRYPSTTSQNTWNCISGISQNNSGNCIYLYIDKYKDGSDASKSLLQQELQANPVTVIYELATPTYEPIENVELITYLETTHISNNSLIPCNMVVKNTGYNTIAIKSSTLYTVALDKNGSGTISANLCGATATTTTNTLTLTTPATLTSDLLTLSGKGVKGSNIRLLEGDKTSTIPGYFEGMKSVGQDDVSGHKVEIVSQNKNLFNKNDIIENKYLQGTIANNYGVYGESQVTNISNYMEVKKGYTYIFSYDYETVLNTSSRGYCYYDRNKNLIPSDSDTLYPVTTKEKTFTPQQDGYIRIAYDKNCTNIQFEQSNSKTSYVDYNVNKKQIPLSAPLRGLPNGVKDKFVKIGGKWFVERNCGKFIITGDKCPIKCWANSTGNTVNGYFYFNEHSDKTLTNIKTYGYSINNKLPSNQGGHIATKEGIIITDYVALSVHKDKLGVTDVNDSINNDTLIRAWFNDNPTTVIYELATPTYEPIENIELITYLDTTHISNNSLIPCTMQVKNTGYNAIIKPSTLYTVALDTNKSGTIGLNLGGAKVTTTNNVATLTTPATLSDDSLRVYGKDIKGSKIRLLEGDKTDWIPSFFEGMKSCFEDKLQDDGNYGVEILSNNKNLLNDLPIGKYSTNDCDIELKSNYIKLTANIEHKGWFYYDYKFSTLLKPNTKYTIKCDIKKSNPNSKACFRIFDLGKTVNYGYINTSGSFTFTTPPHDICDIRLLVYSSIDNVVINKGDTIEYSNIELIEGSNIGAIPSQKHNKIQFSSIEPLRKWDRFIFKDGKLMIERNSKLLTLGIDDIPISKGLPSQVGITTKDSVLLFDVVPPNLKQSWGGSIYEIECDRFKTVYNGKGGVDNSIDHVYWGSKSGHIATMNNFIRLSIDRDKLGIYDLEGFKDWLKNNNVNVLYMAAEPTYEEIPYELQKIILEGYKNGTLFIDTNIPPTVTTTYAGQTPIVSTVNESEVAIASVTSDINDIIIPYLCDMDYRIVALQLQNEPVATMNTYKMFGSTYDMIKRDILSKRYSSTEYLNRISDYHSLGRITDSELNELKQLVTEVLSNE